MNEERDGVQARLDAVVDRVLRAAQALLGCELVALNRISEQDLVVTRTAGTLPGLEPGATAVRAVTTCDRMLAGARAATWQAPDDPAYRETHVVRDLGVRTYVGVPVHDPDHRVIGTLCGFDRRSVPVPERSVRVLEDLARTLTASGVRADDLDLVVLRSSTGWRFSGLPDAAQGLALAAVLAPDSLPPGEERERLVAAVKTLESALQERVAVEQALGVLVERHGSTPREAYGRLRDLGGDGGVVAAARELLHGTR